MNIWPIDRVDGQPFSLSHSRIRVMNAERAPQGEVGLRILGSGLHSFVFGLTERHVLKLTTHRDQSYETFVDLVLNNPNPHFPRIKPLGDWGDNQAYICERLEPCMDREAIEAIYYALDCRKPNPKINYLAEWGHDFWPAIDLMIEAVKTHRYLCPDIGYSNIMQRANGTVVITDPFC